MSKVISVSNYFIYLSNKSKRKNLTNKKLQKLLYYSQAWNLVLHDKKLFRENIEAWVHGPAIPMVYQRFKEFGFEPISIKVAEDDFSELSAEEKKLLDEIWRVYGKYDAPYLEALTHNEIPWQKARKGISVFEASNSMISTNIMKKYYAQKQKEATEK